VLHRDAGGARGQAALHPQRRRVVRGGDPGARARGGGGEDLAWAAAAPRGRGRGRGREGDGEGHGHAHEPRARPAPSPHRLFGAAGGGASVGRNATPQGPSPTATVARTRKAAVSITETVLDRPLAARSVPPSALRASPH